MSFRGAEGAAMGRKSCSWDEETGTDLDGRLTRSYKLTLEDERFCRITLFDSWIQLEQQVDDLWIIAYRLEQSLRCSLFCPWSRSVSLNDQELSTQKNNQIS